MEFEQVIQYGPQGLGDVRFQKSSADVITGAKVVAADGTMYPITPENIAETVVRKDLKGAYFSLSVNEAQLQVVRPYEGTFPVRFGGFTRRGEDENPSPYLKRGGPRQRRHSNGKVSTYQVSDQLRFTSVLNIWAGEHAGYDYIYWLPYVFEAGENGASKARSRSSRDLDRLRGFLKLVGWNLEEEQIPYSDNVLPYLEKQLLERGERAPFMVSIEKGWPVRIDSLPTGMVFAQAE